MADRFVSIWFPCLLSDARIKLYPGLAPVPLALAAPDRGRMKITGVNNIARQKGIVPGMVAADCRAILPELVVADHKEGAEKELLQELALWCLRYTPVVATDEPSGLLLNVTGCAHLWGGERAYLEKIIQQLQERGFTAAVAIAGTPGMAWAAARYGHSPSIVEPGALLPELVRLPPAALRLEPPVTERLEQLGLYHIGDFIDMPRPALRKRFGAALLQRIDQATGREKEYLQPVVPPARYQERLPCPEPVCTAKGIETAIEKLLSDLCQKLYEDAIGLRSAVLKGYRVDGNIQQITISTQRPSRHIAHLLKLFALKISTIEPGLGLELFVMEAPVTEDMPVAQESFWNSGTQQAASLAELLDRIAGRIGQGHIHRYMPLPHYWPERATGIAASLQETPAMLWPDHRPRPVHLLKEPELIEVAVPLPDYPPLLFIHHGKVHKVRKADGPERIEQEWWLETGKHRDYYCVEDENGCRYWLFRSGHYSDNEPEWFLHGFFA